MDLIDIIGAVYRLRKTAQSGSWTEAKQKDPAKARRYFEARGSAPGTPVRPVLSDAPLAQLGASLNALKETAGHGSASPRSLRYSAVSLLRPNKRIQANTKRGPKATEVEFKPIPKGPVRHPASDSLGGWGRAGSSFAKKVKGIRARHPKAGEQT